jgi:hypothetical protein
MPWKTFVVLVFHGIRCGDVVLAGSIAGVTKVSD